MSGVSAIPGGQVLADNHFFPANFTDVALQPPKITVGDYNQTEDKKTINVCTGNFVMVNKMVQ